MQACDAAAFGQVVFAQSFPHDSQGGRIDLPFDLGEEDRKREVLRGGGRGFFVTGPSREGLSTQRLAMERSLGRFSRK
jgi:hypothetical protein